jgi:hypothetical protein
VKEKNAADQVHCMSSGQFNFQVSLINMWCVFSFLYQQELAHEQGSGKREKASLMHAKAQCGGLPHRLHKRLSGKKRRKEGEKSAAYAR